jgi:hypothetical protein
MATQAAQTEVSVAQRLEKIRVDRGLTLDALMKDIKNRGASAVWESSTS